MRIQARGRGVHPGYPPGGLVLGFSFLSAYRHIQRKKKKTTPLHSCMGIVPTQKSDIVSFIILCCLLCCLLACEHDREPAGSLHIDGIPSIYMRMRCVPRAGCTDERGEAARQPGPDHPWHCPPLFHICARWSKCSPSNKPMNERI